MEGGNAVSPGGGRVSLLTTLTPYVPRWTIQARVVERSALTTTRNNQQFFHVDLKDTSDSMIRAKFWGEAAKKWDALIEQGKVYMMSRGKVQVANKRFNTLSHSYEISFFTDAEIKPIADDGLISSTRSLNALMSLRDIVETKRELPFVADILAIITDVQPISTIVSKKTGNELKRRIARLVDRSQHEMEVTLWGSQVDAVEGLTLPAAVVVFGLQIREWQGGRVGSTGKTSELLLNTEAHAEAHARAAQLLQWYTEQGSHVRFTNISKAAAQSFGKNADGEPRRRVEEKMLDQIKEQTEGIFSFIGQIRRVYWRTRQQQHQRGGSSSSSTGVDAPHFGSPGPHSSGSSSSQEGSSSSSGYSQQEGETVLMYPACSKCRKKLIDSGEGNYACYTCDDQHTHPDWRYMLLIGFNDATANLTVRCFADQGEQLLGVPAAELRRWTFKERARLLDVEIPANEHFRVVLRVSMNSYNGEERINRSAVKVERLDILETAKRFTQLLKGILAAASVSDEDFLTGKKRMHLKDKESREEEAEENKGGNVADIKEYAEAVKQEGLVF